LRTEPGEKIVNPLIWRRTRRGKIKYSVAQRQYNIFAIRSDGAAPQQQQCTFFCYTFFVPEKPNVPIDLTLTPENAKERGYNYFCDIFDGMIHDPIVQSMIEDGYKLGKASNKSYVVSAGVYVPVRTQPAKE
jgi:hypothetical protein